MTMQIKRLSKFGIEAKNYVIELNRAMDTMDINAVEKLAVAIEESWNRKKNVYICGNGGSAGNAMHLANDLIYGIGGSKTGKMKCGLSIEALPSNASVITCLANDIGYENIFSHQIEAKGKKGEILIVLSGSGNSENIIKAIRAAKKLGIQTHAIVAFDGGECLKIADNVIHFKIDDMQIAEDTQLIVGHIVMQWLASRS
jgi:D-sedoheptulose 7-phosphate isomerase